jgi:hypothetical protein
MAYPGAGRRHVRKSETLEKARGNGCSVPSGMIRLGPECYVAAEVVKAPFS